MRDFARVHPLLPQYGQALRLYAQGSLAMAVVWTCLIFSHDIVGQQNLDIYSGSDLIRA